LPLDVNDAVTTAVGAIGGSTTEPSNDSVSDASVWPPTV
jgi:hypothetical protein